MYIFSPGKKITKTIINFSKRVGCFFPFLSQWFRFRSKNDKRFPLRYRNIPPCVKGRVTTTPFDQNYTYHPAWAAGVLAKTQPKLHIDISSILNFSAVASASIPMKFYDYRPAHLQLNNFESDFTDLKKLPFENDSVESLSCMHTIEHIGLGRYGDELDAKGDIKAIEELITVTQPGGTIIFVTPVGKPKIEFNAHRIYSFEQITGYFKNCDLVEFALIPDAGGLQINADPALVKDQKYGCACFCFKKIAS